MKIWVKLLAGIIVGVILAFVLGDARAMSTLETISTVVIHIGRYALFPLALFGGMVAMYELKREKNVNLVLGRIAVYLIASSLLLAIIGTFSTIILAPERIPIVIEEEIVYSTPKFSEMLLTIFPKNLFRVLIESGDFLLPIFVVACVIGLNLNFDRLATRPAIQLFDSLNRVFYNLNAFVLEVFALGIIPIAATFVLRLTNMQELELYRQIILVLVIDSVAIVFIIYPILIYLLAGKRNPYVWIYASLATLLTAAATGDAYLTLASQARHGKENFGVPRRIGAISLPIFTLFGKAGTAMVTAASFVLIVTSYSSLGISFGQTIWIMLFSFFASMAVGPYPGIGIIIALSILSRGFASGYEEGYLILMPIVPLLMSFAITIDALTASLATMLVARHSGVQAEIDRGDYA